MIIETGKRHYCMLRGECMREQLLLLIRISRPEYNKTLYNGYKLFMNPQMI